MAGTHNRQFLWALLLMFSFLASTVAAGKTTDTSQKSAFSPSELNRIFALLDKCKSEREDLFQLKLQNKREEHCSHVGLIPKDGVWEHGHNRVCHIALDVPAESDSDNKRCLVITQFFVKPLSRVQVGGGGFQGVYVFSPSKGRGGEYRLVASKGGTFALTSGDHYAVAVFPEGGLPGTDRWGLGIGMEPKSAPESAEEETDDTPDSDG